MATEPFLVNPPKRAPKRKASAKKKSGKHRILAIKSKGGGLFTSSKAKIVRKGIKLNPFRRFRKNPLGEELMFVGLNPFKKGGSAMAYRKRSKKRSYKKNPARRRRYRRNPMSSPKSLIPMVVAGGAGALIGRALTPVVPILNRLGVLGSVLTKGAVAFGGAWLLDRTIGNKFKGVEDGWMIGSLASAAADISGVGVVRGLQGLGLIEDDTLAPYNGDTEVSGIVESEMSGIVDPYMSGIEDPY